MKSWFNHIYLTNLYDALNPSKSSLDFEAPLKGVLIDSAPINFEDEGLQRFFSVVGFSTDEQDASLRAIKSAFFQWVLGHSWGPGSYDSTSVDSLFELSSLKGGFDELDRVFGHIAQTDNVSLSGVIQSTVILHDPKDPGLHGDSCYRSHLDLVAIDLPNMYGRRASMAMGSSLEYLIPLVIAEVEAQSERFNLAQDLGCHHPEYKNETSLRRAKPTKVYVELNGVDFLSADIPNQNLGDQFVIDWGTVVHDGDVSTMKSLSSALPKVIGRKVKAKFLEDELGM